jgi:hypothetical protein
LGHTECDAYLRLFVQSLDQGLDGLCEALDSGNPSRAAQTAQDLIAVASRVGALKLATTAQAMAELCRKGGDVEAIRPTLLDVTTLTRSAVTAWLQTHKAPLAEPKMA